MTIAEVHDLLNFYINKYQGRYYDPEELDENIDAGQMALFSQLRPIYATSQRNQDALAPFLETYDFTTLNSVSGVFSIPSNVEYVALLSIDITYSISGRGTIYEAVPIVSKDEKAIRLRSQLDPVSETAPICEILAPRYFRLYPLQGYNGVATFFRRPTRPVFAYSTISGRVIVYNPADSVQLEWNEDWHNAVVMKTLEILGVNLSDQDVTQFAEAKTMQNFQNVNNT